MISYEQLTAVAGEERIEPSHSCQPSDSSVGFENHCATGFELKTLFILEVVDDEETMLFINVRGVGNVSGLGC